MKNKFLQVCLGISMLFISGGFLVYTINPAQASIPAPNKFIDGETNKIGKYMMVYGAPSGGDAYTVIILDTENGNSICYTFNNSRRIWTKDPDSEQLPKHPFDN